MRRFPWGVRRCVSGLEGHGWDFLIMKSPVRLPVLLTAWFALTLGVSCQSRVVQKVTKAKPAPISPFLEMREQMQPARDRLPVHFVWRNESVEVQVEVMRRRELFIAPVELRYLQPVSKRLARWEMGQGWTQRNEAEMAEQLRARFARAFEQSAQPRYRLVSKPGPESVTLELAITQLTPTSVRGNVVRTASKVVIGPLSRLLGVFTSGHIAIEGKVSLSDRGTPVFQFSDRERDKETFYSVRDFRPYGHALVAMDEWAAQFEEFTRTFSDHRVKESSFMTLKPW